MGRVLRRVRELRKELEFLNLKICDLDLVKPKISVIELIPSSTGRSAHGLDELLCTKEKLIHEYDALLLEYCKLYDLGLKTIRDRLDGLELKILELFYLQAKSWKEVSETLHISQSWCFKLHSRGLQKIVKDR